MKEKIASAIKTKYANLGLSQEAIDGVASLLEKTITEEASIETSIAGDNVASYLKSLQSSFDKLRGESSTARKALEDYKKLHPDTKPDEVKQDEGNAELAAAMERIAALEKRNADNEQRIRVETIKSDVDRLLKEGGATNDYVRKNVLRSLEVGEQDTAEGLVAKYKPVYESEMKEAYGNGVIAPKGNLHSDDYKKGDFADVKKLFAAEGLIPNE